MNKKQDNSNSNGRSGWTNIFNMSTTGHTVISTLRETNAAIETSSEQCDIETIHADAAICKNLPDLMDEFEPGSVFAEGGQGIIRSGIDRNLKRQVAIKTLKPEVADDENRSLFVQEAKITAQLCHPAIVPIYSLNTDRSDGLHLTMKLVRGRTLKSYMEQVALAYRRDGIDLYDEKKSLAFRLEVFLRVCDALDYAHNRNIMHCDLKPENILIGEFRETYIMDWGIAHEIIEPGYDPATWQSPNTIAGTPRFLSPEAIHGAHTDQRADIYTMGLILFEIVSFNTAYSGDSNDVVVAKIREGKIAPLVHRFGYRIDADLRAIIAKATSFDREKRYQHINELASDLRKYLAREETTANPYNILRKTISIFLSRKKTTISAVVVLVLIFLALITFNYISFVRQSERFGIETAAISSCLSNSAESAAYIDSSLSAGARFLSSLTAEYLFLVQANLKNEDNMQFYTTADMHPASATAPPGMTYSSIYHRKVNFDYFSVKTADCSPLTPEQRTMAAHIYRMQPICKQAFLSLVPDDIRGQGEEKILDYISFTGIPFHNILFGFENGLYAVLPGRSGYADNYDPRARIWYKIAKDAEAGKIVWTKPYPGITTEAGYLITCSIGFYDRDDNYFGTVGIDIRLKSIQDYLSRNGNAGDYVIEKTLLDKNGKVIVSTGRDFADAVDSDLQEIDLDFRYPDLFQIAQKNKFTATRIKLPVNSKNGETVETECLCCVNYLPCLDWYYIEVLDFNKLFDM